MNGFSFFKSKTLFIEIAHDSFRAMDGEAGLELPLDRDESGRLTPECQERLAAGLRKFLKKNRGPRPRAFCAIAARGLSLRRISIPAVPKANVRQLLALQIEREFPLGPEDLAWGWLEVNSEQAGGSAPGVQEVIVAAAKREVIEEYAGLLVSCGLEPVFTLSAWAGSLLCANPPGSYAVLNIGRRQSELISFERGLPLSIRPVPVGGDDLSRAVADALQISFDEAERLLINRENEPGAPGAGPVESAIRAVLDEWAGSITPVWTGPKLFLAGKICRFKPLETWLAEALGGIACERIEPPPGPGRSAAILGLRKACENGCLPSLLIQTTQGNGRKENGLGAVPWKWAALAILLGLGSLTIRYAEAFLKKPGLVRQIAEIKANSEDLARLDRELSFLQFLQTNQPPYLDVIAVLGNSSARGTRVESLSMNRRGDLSLRGTVQNPQQATELRAKLIDSGLFSTVVIEEQTPAPNNRGVAVRISARWKPGVDLKSNADEKPPSTVPAPAPSPAESVAPPPTRI